MAKLSDMTVTVELTDKAQSQLDYMQVQIESIRAEITDRNALRERLTRTEEKLGELNATCSWQGHELLRLQAERDGLRRKLAQFDAVPVVPSRNYRQCMEENARLRAFYDAIPWGSMWAYFTHGDYGPGTWREIDEWLRKNMPKVEVQP